MSSISPVPSCLSYNTSFESISTNKSLRFNLSPTTLKGSELFEDEIAECWWNTEDEDDFKTNAASKISSLIEIVDEALEKGASLALSGSTKQELYEYGVGILIHQAELKDDQDAIPYLKTIQKIQISAFEENSFKVASTFIYQESPLEILKNTTLNQAQVRATSDLYAYIKVTLDQAWDVGCAMSVAETSAQDTLCIGIDYMATQCRKNHSEEEAEVISSLKIINAELFQANPYLAIDYILGYKTIPKEEAETPASQNNYSGDHL
ncbi:MAG: hypothetical protein FJZ56_04120 [Chlamydiae bacterium]|nr:hypothetical protein [Chlamydiota bacterium]